MSICTHSCITCVINAGVGVVGGGGGGGDSMSVEPMYLVNVNVLCMHVTGVVDSLGRLHGRGSCDTKAGMAVCIGTTLDTHCPLSHTHHYYSSPAIEEQEMTDQRKVY